MRFSLNEYNLAIYIQIYKNFYYCIFSVKQTTIFSLVESS